MLRRIQLVLIVLGVISLGTELHGQLVCPGYNPANNTNLACEIPTATRGTSGPTDLAVLPATVAAQLGQLPIATAVSGSGLAFSKSLGVFTSDADSLGTIMTRRGDTIGKHKFYAAFTYQRFHFDAIDGVELDDLPTVAVTASDPQLFIQGTSKIDFTVDQFTAVGSFGLTSRIDATFVVPFSRVSLSTRTAGSQYGVGEPVPIPEIELQGTASGIGDVMVNIKANIFKGESSSLAVAGEVRFPTGDEKNYLGSGAFGVKPYLVFSHRGRITPNFSIGYQWNGRSILYADPTTGEELNIPSSVTYSGGAEVRVTSKFTLLGEFVGQCVLDGPRLKTSTVTIPGEAQPARSVTPYSSTYTMNNAGGGFKFSPVKGLVISGSVLFALDDGGLRSKILPLAGISYTF